MDAQKYEHDTVDALLTDRGHLQMLLYKMVKAVKQGVYLPNTSDHPDCMELIDDIQHELEIRFGVK